MWTNGAGMWPDQRGVDNVEKPWWKNMGLPDVQALSPVPDKTAFAVMYPWCACCEGRGTDWRMLSGWVVLERPGRAGKVARRTRLVQGWGWLASQHGLGTLRPPHQPAQACHPQNACCRVCGYTPDEDWSWFWGGDLQPYGADTFNVKCYYDNEPWSGDHFTSTLIPPVWQVRSAVQPVWCPAGRISVTRGCLVPIPTKQSDAPHSPSPPICAQLLPPVASDPTLNPTTECH